HAPVERDRDAKGDGEGVADRESGAEPQEAPARLAGEAAVGEHLEEPGPDVAHGREQVAWVLEETRDQEPDEGDGKEGYGGDRPARPAAGRERVHSLSADPRGPRPRPSARSWRARTASDRRCR